jgi:hypothetical protein
MNKKILVSIVNYCDPEFEMTVKDLWDNAKFKKDLIFSLVSEDTVRYSFDYIPQNQIIYRHFDTSEYRGGVCWARNLAVDVDIDYDFLMQFDSHTLSVYGWDDIAFKTFYNISKKTDRFIISHAPSNYEYLEDGSITKDIPNKFAMYANNYSEIVPGFTFPMYDTLKENEVVVSYWATCCYLFAPKKWVDEVGISKDSSFNTEEISLSIRTYANGWNIFAVGLKNIFHHTSHKQPNGVITRQTLRPWADDRKDFYWQHVELATNNLSKLMSGQLDVPKEKAIEFLNKVNIPSRYSEYIKEYYKYIDIPERPLGMPPRRF